MPIEHCLLAPCHGRKADEETPSRPLAGLTARSAEGTPKETGIFERGWKTRGAAAGGRRAGRMNLIAQLEAEQVAALVRVAAVLNHGASDLLEIAGPGFKTPALLPFTREAVPAVDVSGGRIVADPPAGIFPDVEKD